MKSSPDDAARRQSANLSRARRDTPPVPAAEALRRQLHVVLLGAISDTDVQQIAQKLRDEALAGDMAAVKILLGLITAAPRSESGGVNVQQAVVVNGRRDGPVGLSLALLRLIAEGGPDTQANLALSVGAPQHKVGAALEDEWFEKDAGGRYRLSHKGQAVVNAEREGA